MSKVVTIQRTPKKLKFLVFIANAVEFVGVVMILNQQPAAAITTLSIGVALHIVARILIWWFHD
jgi:hypothetical protein